MFRSHIYTLCAGLFLLTSLQANAQEKESKRSYEWPDIVLESIALTPDNPSNNNPCEITVVVSNRSANPCEPFALRVYIDGEQLSERRISAGPFSQVKTTLTWTSPKTGEHQITAIADQERSIRERDYSDNIQESVVQVFSLPADAEKRKQPTLVPPLVPQVFPGANPVVALDGGGQAAIDRWVSRGPTFISDIENYPWAFAGGRLSAIAIHPTNTNTMYVGGLGCGVWKTTDGGQNWISLTDRISMSVAALALAPNNPNVVFWVTAHEGVFRSDNAGGSWTKISNRDLNATVHGGKLVILPSDPQVMFVKSPDGLYRSGDGGATWSRVGPLAAATGLEFSTFNNSQVFAAFSHDTNNDLAGLFQSNDKGLNWTKKLGCPGAALPAVVKDYNITLAYSQGELYMGFKNANEFKLYRTTNLACNVGGVSDDEWEKGWSTTTNHKELWSGLWANPLDKTRLYLGGTAFWRSTDSGSSFSKVSDYNTPSGSAHADHHGFAVLPGNKNTIFTLNDGGIYRSESNGNKGSWVFIGKGITNVEFYDFASSFTNPSLMIGGTQDNGIMKTTGNTTWDAVRGGDGATVDIDDANADIMYSLGQYANSVCRSTNGGSSWPNFASGLPDGSTCFNMRFHLHPKNGNILLASCSGLWKKVGTGAWQTIFTPPFGDIACSAVEPRSDLYLAGSNFGKVYGGIGGAGFQLAFDAGASGISDIEIEPETGDYIYVSTAGTALNRVFRVKRGNAFPFQGQNITSDLPTGLTVKCLAIDRMNPYTIYAGTNKGIYRGKSTDQGQTWTWKEYMNGFPVADVVDLEVHPVTGVLSACTYGRGIYEVDTGDPVGSVLAREGKVVFLRAHDVGTGFGPPGDALDAEMIVKLDSAPDDYYGAQLRTDNNEAARDGMLEILRKSFKLNLRVRIEYVRTGIHSGKILRVMFP